MLCDPTLRLCGWHLGEPGREGAVGADRTVKNSTEPGVEGTALPRAAASLGLCLCLAAFTAFAGLLLSACGRPKQAVEKYPFSTEARTDFIVGAGGLSVLDRKAPLPAGPALPSPLAPRAACLASLEAKGGPALAVLNRLGLAFIVPDAAGRAFLVRNLPLQELAGQSAAALWPHSTLQGEGFLLELFHDPFTQNTEPRNPFAPELLAVARDGGVRRIDRLGKPDEDLFALFPGPGGKWYAEFRAENALGAVLRYAVLASPDAIGAGGAGAEAAQSPIRRDLFEAALAPRPLSAAPEALRRAAGALGVNLDGATQLLIHAFGADGTDGYWLSGGLPENAAEAYAWLSGDTRRAVLLLRSGRGSFVRDASPAKDFSLEPPMAGAEFTAATALGTAPGEKGFLVAAWELGAFPLVSAAGVTTAPLP